MHYILSSLFLPTTYCDTNLPLLFLLNDHTHNDTNDDDDDDNNINTNNSNTTTTLTITNTMRVVSVCRFACVPVCFYVSASEYLAP